MAALELINDQSSLYGFLTDLAGILQNDLHEELVVWTIPSPREIATQAINQNSLGTQQE
jgi:hypothetical protein